MGSSGRGVPADWYVTGFDAATTGLMWAELAVPEVDRALGVLDLAPGARVLDLACGVGSHAIELARRGYEVVAVDRSKEMLDLATGEAAREGVGVSFVAADIRELDYDEVFDAVLNLHDGAIGYLEDDAENRRLFEVIARALRPGGSNLIQVPNAAYAEAHLPQRTWRASRRAVELVERHWADHDGYVEGEVTPVLLDDVQLELRPAAFRQRLYTVAELRELYGSVGMTLVAVLGEDGEPLEPGPAEEEIFALARKD